ncbi:hypothetical protein TNCV_521241 [Trichonephila clavipes]|nr:hypothetical protein TNCV_521241 [Trichonephila clavipes]
MDLVILKNGQMTRATPELAPPLLTTTPHQREDISSLSKDLTHRCPTAGLLWHWDRTRDMPTMIRYLDHLIPRPQVRRQKASRSSVEKRESATLISPHLIKLYEI